MLVIVLVSSPAPLAAADFGLPLSVAELTARAIFVVLGRVVTTESGWDTARPLIVTRVDLVVDEILKGPVPGKMLSLRELGGKVGEAASVVADAPLFAPGERVLVFLTFSRDGRLHVVGLHQGKFSLEHLDGGEEMAVRRRPGSAAVLDQTALEAVKHAIAAGSPQ
jgi:hypothetical protein